MRLITLGVLALTTVPLPGANLIARPDVTPALEHALRTPVIAARFDTLFPPGTSLHVARDGSLLRGPGRGLAALLGIVAALDAGYIRTNRTLLFVGDVAEEGEANPRGVKYRFGGSAFRELYRTPDGLPTGGYRLSSSACRGGSSFDQTGTGAAGNCTSLPAPEARTLFLRCNWVRDASPASHAVNAPFA